MEKKDTSFLLTFFDFYYNIFMWHRIKILCVSVVWWGMLLGLNIWLPYLVKNYSIMQHGYVSEILIASLYIMIQLFVSVGYAIILSYNDDGDHQIIQKLILLVKNILRVSLITMLRIGNILLHCLLFVMPWVIYFVKTLFILPIAIASWVDFESAEEKSITFVEDRRQTTWRWMLYMIGFFSWRLLVAFLCVLLLLIFFATTLEITYYEQFMMLYIIFAWLYGNYFFIKLLTQRTKEYMHHAFIIWIIEKTYIVIWCISLLAIIALTVLIILVDNRFIDL